MQLALRHVKMIYMYLFLVVKTFAERDIAGADPLVKSPWLGRNGRMHGASYGSKYLLREMRWTASPEFVKLVNNLTSPNLDVYEFGVYTGGSMRDMVKRIQGRYGTLWGFDSFTGLPAEAKGVQMEGKHWNPGAWSSASVLNESSPNRLFAALRRKIRRSNGPVRFVRGFYNESLTPDLKERLGLQPALLVDVDADLYVSAKQCLEFMLREGLIVAGTLVRYDDWKGDVSWGETRAHQELTAEWGVEWRTIGEMTGSYAEFQLIKCRLCSPTPPTFAMQAVARPG